MHTREQAPSHAGIDPKGAKNVAAARHPLTGVAPVFLLSPASLSGVRGRRLLAGAGSAVVSMRIAAGERAPIGEVYASISSLYFRGKLAYARRYGRQPHSTGVRVITPDRGLCAADETVDLADLRRMARTAIDEREPAYRDALVASAEELHRTLPESALVVLLGSLATKKYLDPLSTVLGERLCVPRAFIGLGDMSRGGLLLRAASEGPELEYVRVSACIDQTGMRARRRASS
ncbi:MAG: hypothetical protein AB7T31_09980 [Gemmatimonadales bacterium]